MEERSIWYYPLLGQTTVTVLDLTYVQAQVKTETTCLDPVSTISVH